MTGSFGGVQGGTSVDRAHRIVNDAGAQRNDEAGASVAALPDYAATLDNRFGVNGGTSVERTHRIVNDAGAHRNHEAGTGISVLLD
ncbi:MAG TPA: hypothetical protein VHW24_00230 [Bryobacteraceae bacterium]|nr:hypothetical protein [Bryobacteraceae bacterium]